MSCPFKLVRGFNETKCEDELMPENQSEQVLDIYCKCGEPMMIETRFCSIQPVGDSYRECVGEDICPIMKK